MNRAVVILFVLLACALCGFNEGRAQAVEIADPVCQQLKENTPLFFIAYERAEQKNNKTKEIVLRLHNNSSCDAAFLSNIVSSIRLAKRTDGSLKIDHTRDLQENMLNNLVFRIVRWKDKKRISLNTDGCLVFTRRLASGKSTLFTVPEWQFKKRSDFGMEFEYFWENQDNQNYGKHNFFSQEIKLPNDAWKVKSPTKQTFLWRPSPVTLLTQ